MAAGRTNNFLLSITRIVIFFVCAFLPCSLNAQEVSVSNWWDDNAIIATGTGYAPSKAKNPYHARMLAYRAAITDGYRNLAEKVGEIHITAESTIESQILSGDIVETKVDAVIRGATVLSEEFSEDGGCHVVLSVPIFGVTDSLAKVALKPVDKEEFPRPSENFVANENTEGNYTGLIIDCGDVDLNPVLLPVIRNADNLSIYGYNNLEYDKAVTGGVVGYVTRDTAQAATMLLSRGNALPMSYTALIERKLLLLTSQSSENNISRAGNNPLIIKAESMSDGNSCPVVSISDADKILAENQASHFLDNGAVVFTSYRVGGVRV